MPRLGEIAAASSVASTAKAVIIQENEEYLATMPQVAEVVRGELGDDFAEKTKIISSIQGTTLLLADNTEYRLTNVSNLTLTYPSGNFECWLRISTAASGAVHINLPNTSKYIGSAADMNVNSGEFEVSIKDGIVIIGEVGDGS